jgi:hypothetical protein
MPAQTGSMVAAGDDPLGNSIQIKSKTHPQIPHCSDQKEVALKDIHCT